ncbi:MAG: hypothetical protein QOC81_3070 [Thermoanaerobaculia bacterium]|jgi:hypothetical protein|nr:hypothetical protein [Thermoanaerobaculia bacterium]
MNDQDFVDAFEQCTLSSFHHRDHVRLAWVYLRDLPLLDALERFTTSLRRFAAAKGNPGLYHATITWAYLLLIHERMERKHADDFDSFALDNADLLTWKPSVLDTYYDRATLDSDLARRTFLMPDAGSRYASSACD